MAVFCIEWLLAAQLVLNLPTVTATCVAGFKVRVVVMDLVGCTMFPLIELAFGAA